MRLFDIMSYDCFECPMIFDIGANIGLFFDQCRPKFRSAVLVEPNHLLCSQLREKYKGADVDIHIEEASIDRRNGFTELWLCREDNQLSTTSRFYLSESIFARKGYSWESASYVRTLTIDSLIDKYGMPEFIKIDAEGSEYLALSGLSKPVRAIAFEYGESLLFNIYLCLRRIEELGAYKYTYISGELSIYTEMSLSKLVDGKEILDHLYRCIYEKKTEWGSILALRED